jgi:hypothetical protein
VRDSFQPKLIYLARRHPSLDRQAFTRRWRKHAQLGMSRPRWINIARYVHCDIELPRPEERGFLGDHDGIGMIGHKSPEHRAAHIADSSSRLQMESDEAATFAEPITEVCLLAREEIMLAPPANAAIKLTCFSERDFPLARPAEALGHVVSHALPRDQHADGGLGSRLVEEFWFGSRDSAVAAARDIPRQAADVVVISNQVLLYP